MLTTIIGVHVAQMAVNPTMSLNSIVTSSTLVGWIGSPKSIRATIVIRVIKDHTFYLKKKQFNLEGLYHVI